MAPRINVQPRTQARGNTMKRGRPKATGPYKTHAELVAGVLERHNKGKSMRGIARILNLSEPTITKIIRENRSA